MSWNGLAGLPAVLGIAMLVAGAAVAGGQQAARLEGMLTDSLRSAPLADARVVVTRDLPEQPEFLRVVTTGPDGRFRIDSLAAGRYTVAFEHPLLDSLELFYPPRVIDVVAGGATRVDFGVPSGATLRRAACPGVALGTGTGGVIGRVLDADTELPMGGVYVLASWTELAVDRETLRASTIQRTGATRADSAGVYRLCGVATANILAVQVQTGGRAGSAVRTEVPDDIGFARLDLSFSASDSRPILDASAPTDSAASGGVSPPALSGAAAMSGVVRGAGGAPLAGVEIRVVDAAGSARSDSAGTFTLGGLPAGSQMLEARRVGYLIARRPVSLRVGRPADVQLRLERIVSLDSIRIVAQRQRYREFEVNRRSGVGRYLTGEQIAARQVFETSELFAMMPGLRVVEVGIRARVINTRPVGFSRTCAPNVVIDNVPGQEINLIRPADIGAMEIYTGGTGGPPGLNKGCGVIVIWTRR